MVLSHIEVKLNLYIADLSRNLVLDPEVVTSEDYKGSVIENQEGNGENNIYQQFEKHSKYMRLRLPCYEINSEILNQHQQKS